MILGIHSIRVLIQCTSITILILLIIIIILEILIWSNDSNSNITIDSGIRNSIKGIS